VNRFIIPGLLLLCLIVAFLALPKNGDAGQDHQALTVVYTGDVIGKTEPCG
jgi:hypothetical protein